VSVRMEPLVAVVQSAIYDLCGFAEIRDGRGAPIVQIFSSKRFNPQLPIKAIRWAAETELRSELRKRLRRPVSRLYVDVYPRGQSSFECLNPERSANLLGLTETIRELEEYLHGETLPEEQDCWKRLIRMAQEDWNCLAPGHIDGNDPCVFCLTQIAVLRAPAVILFQQPLG
jgi:hypothetical protein